MTLRPVQEAIIKDLNEDPEQDLLRMIYTVELQRIKYSLRCYLRARLKKLEQHVMHCLDDPNMKDRLSDKEVKYAEDYFLLLGGSLSACGQIEDRSDQMVPVIYILEPAP